jgi:hypothetical protein
MLKPKKPFESKQPVSINEAFNCKNCGRHNPKAQKTCRNHCRHCLFSRHVDEKTPGDRKSRCNALMRPLYIDHSGKKGLQIIHICLLCGKKSANMAAPDDNPEALAEIMRHQNLNLHDESGKKNAKK